MGPSPFTVTLHIRVLYAFLILSKYNAAVNKPHWEPKNFCTNDNCSVRDSKNVCWWACGNRWTFIFMYSLSYLDFTYFLPLGLVHSWLTLLDIWFEAPHPFLQLEQLWWKGTNLGQSGLAISEKHTEDWSLKARYQGDPYQDSFVSLDARGFNLLEFVTMTSYVDFVDFFPQRPICSLLRKGQFARWRYSCIVMYLYFEFVQWKFERSSPPFHVN